MSFREQDYDPELEDALERSLQFYDEDEELQNALAASLEQDAISKFEEFQKSMQRQSEEPVDAIDQALAASLESQAQSKLAVFYTDKLTEKQDLEYEESLMKDRERDAFHAKQAAQAAEKAAQEAAIALQKAKDEEAYRKDVDSLQPPELKYSIEDGPAEEIYSLKFRFPNGRSITHSFNMNEPLETVIEQLRFDTKYVGNFLLKRMPNIIVDCSPSESLYDCGIVNRDLIIVEEDY